MRIGLYGLPSAGKSFVLNKIDFIKVIEGSKTLKKLYPEFDFSDDIKKNEIRKKFAEWLYNENDFIMDGHYSFGEKIAFTEADGELYDVFLYLYIKPEILYSRIRKSKKNITYSGSDIGVWQKNEIKALRKYCHEHDKDFYVIDNTVSGYFDDVCIIIEFIKAVHEGFSCEKYAKWCTNQILRSVQQQKCIFLADGDKTITLKDTCKQIYGYTTNIFDNNFYTGFQTWKHYKNLTNNFALRPYNGDAQEFILNSSVVKRLGDNSYILTSGDGNIWKNISLLLHMGCFYGAEMSADAKFFITKYLRRAGKYITAYGDSINDFYMLKEADDGYLVVNPKGEKSKSLKDIDLGGIHIVRAGEIRKC